MQPEQRAISRPTRSILATNVVLRKTYTLLAATLVFSALMAGFAMITNAQPLNPFITILIYFGLLFLVSTMSKKPVAGIVAVFALTGFLGYTLGPILELYLRQIPNGGQLIMTALGGTGVIFFSLSAYALISKKDFSYLGGFLLAGIMVAFLAGIGAMVFHLPMLSLVVSAAFILLSSGLILFQTSQIIHGGETNYVMATVTLYVSLFNIFVNLLRILSAFSSRN